MPSLYTLLRISLTLLAAARVQGAPQDGLEGAVAGNAVAPAKAQATDGATAPAQAEAGLATLMTNIHHDAVVTISQITPTGINGTLYLAYQPRLKVINGCVPFPAVDNTGHLGYVSW